jgi:phage gp36-like protein
VAGSTYSTQPDLNLDADRLIELTDTSAAPGVLNQTVVDNTSLQAQSIIDARLGGTYLVPFDANSQAVPDAIRRLHAALWRYLLFEHRDALNIPPSEEDAYKQARSDLKDLASPDDGGEFLLGATRVSGAAGSTSEGSFSADRMNTAPVCPTFGRYRDKLG